MNKIQQSEEQRFSRLRVLEKRAKRALWKLAREAHAPVKTGFYKETNMAAEHVNKTRVW